MIPYNVDTYVVGEKIEIQKSAKDFYDFYFSKLMMSNSNKIVGFCHTHGHNEMRLSTLNANTGLEVT